MFRIFLAGRYMFARRISYLAMGAIGVAVAALIIVISVMNGFLDQTRDLVRGTTADIVVLPAQGLGRGRNVSRDEYERVVAGVQGVTGACSRLVRPAVAKVHGSSNVTFFDSMFASLNQVIVLGIEPDDERGVTDLARYLADVEDPSFRVEDPYRPFQLHRGLILDRALRNADLPRVLVGEARLRTLGLSRGQALEFVTVPDGEELGGDTIRSTTETFVISGGFSTGQHTFDMSNVFVQREDFRRWTSTKQELSEMYVTVTDPERLDEVRDAVAAALDEAGLGATVESWTDRHAIYLGAVENERNILAFVLSLFVLLTCTITFSMLTMMVQEKVRDIGILSAMGAASGGIGAIFAVCGVYVAGLGGLIGLGLGTLVADNVNSVKDWIEHTFDVEIFRRDVYAFTEIPSLLDHRLNLWIVLATTLFSIVICMLPALRAARMDPVEALRHE